MSSSAAAVRVGCSECVCIAIESHCPALLRTLLARRHVVYRDVFWAPLPSAMHNTPNVMSNEFVPQLHRISARADLSCVGRDDCGHVRVDVELHAPLRFGPTAYILVSLVKMAQWHSCDEHFPALHMLRNSGHFDLSEPQFFHLFVPFKQPKYVDEDERDDYDIECFISGESLVPGPLNVTEGWVLQYELERRGRRAPLVPFQLACDVHDADCSHRQLFPRRSEATLTLSGKCYGSALAFNKYYGKLEPLFELMAGQDAHEYDAENADATLLKLLHKQLESGADLNLYWISEHGLYSSSRDPLWRMCRFVDTISLMHFLYPMALHTTCSSCVQTPSEFNAMLKFALRNGFSYFLGCVNDVNVSDEYEKRSRWSIISRLFRRQRLSLFPFAMGVAAQLLSLGYGRRELHPACLPVFDGHLDATRDALFELLDIGEVIGAGQLQLLIESFDAGPLTLRELSRIAIRRAVGGAYFERRVRALKGSFLPAPLLKYVADPTELMLDDEQLLPFAPQ